MAYGHVLKSEFAWLKEHAFYEYSEERKRGDWYCKRTGRIITVRAVHMARPVSADPQAAFSEDTNWTGMGEQISFNKFFCSSCAEPHLPKQVFLQDLWVVVPK